jgi:two-component system OmpR family response regulator
VPGRSVILLDDSEIVRETARAVLDGGGLSVRTAADLFELEALLAEGIPDIFVLDVQMPEAFGHDVGLVLRKVRGLEVPIILFSSLDDQALADRVREAGLDGFVSKREGLAALLARIQTMLDERSRP